MERALTLAAIGLCLGVIAFLTIFRGADAWVEPGGSMSGLERGTTIFLCALLGSIVIVSLALATASIWLPDGRLRPAQLAVAAIALIALVHWAVGKTGNAAPFYPNAKPVLDLEVRTTRAYLKGAEGLT